MWRILLSIIIALGSVINVCAQSDGMVECWSGKLSVGGAKLGMSFAIKTLPDSSQVCTMDVPQQNAKNIPVTLVKNDSEVLEISIPLLGASYKGRKVQPTAIEGTFVQRGMSLPLNLELGTLELNRPQTPKPPYMYATEDVTFSNDAEGAVLSGTLTYPVNYYLVPKDSIPVVLMVTGSGAQNRDEEIFDHKPFLVIADFLAKNGIASLRYDDRGVGKSTGPTAGTTTENNLADAEAGIAYLRSLGTFGKVGVLGHSEGGTIAFMMGANKSVDFLVSLAGTAISGVDVIVGQNEAIMKQQGVPVSVISDYAKALRMVYNDRVDGKSVADVSKYVDDLCAAHQLALSDAYKANLAQCFTAGGEWITWFLAYDPIDAIRKITCPVMALNGDMDLQVLSEDNLPVIKENLPTGDKNTIKEYSSLNHLFQHTTPQVGLNYGAIEETISEEVLHDIQSWINTIK